MLGFNPTLILAAILAIAISGGLGYYSGYSSGGESVQQKWDKEKAQIAEAFAAELARVRTKEAKLQDTADKQRKAKNEAQKVIAAQSSALVDSLRDRPDRSEADGVSEDTGTCSAATGASLARGDGEFLARYATDALRLQNEFDHCVAQYNAIKEMR